MNLVLFLFMLIVFISYVSFIWIKYGIQESISDSYYVLPNNLKLLFTLFCWGFAIPAIIVGVNLSDNYLMFLAGAGIGFVGAATAFKEKMTRTVHMIGAYSGVAFSQLSIAIDFKMYYVNILFIVLSLIIIAYKIKNHIWWLEILAFSIICYVLGYQIFINY